MMASYEERNASKPIMHEHDNHRELVATIKGALKMYPEISYQAISLS
jgi:hypothetical protein